MFFVFALVDDMRVTIAEFIEKRMGVPCVLIRDVIARSFAHLIFIGKRGVDRIGYRLHARFRRFHGKHDIARRVRERILRFALIERRRRLQHLYGIFVRAQNGQKLLYLMLRAVGAGFYRQTRVRVGRFRHRPFSVSMRVFIHRNGFGYDRSANPAQSFPFAFARARCRRIYGITESVLARLFAARARACRKQHKTERNAHNPKNSFLFHF